jgi:FMN reductase [NAD(P)H]
MNKLKSKLTSQILDSRTSVRQFTGEEVKKDDVQKIVTLAQKSATSINGQQISLIVTYDKDKIEKIGDIAWGQPQVKTADVFITLVADFNRTNEAMKLQGKEQKVTDSIEALLVAGVDAGIMAQSIQLLSNEFGYGSTMIGGIRANPEQLISLLELPKNTFPILGITLGVTNEEVNLTPRPRVNVDSFAMDEKYDIQKVKEGVVAYDQKLASWWKNEHNLSDKDSYAASIASFYDKDYAPKVFDSLQSQGFIESLVKKESK